MKYFRFTGLLFFILCLLSLKLIAQVPQVESTLKFAGMKLHLTEQARRDIQSSVDALYRSEKHFNIMLERVDLYLPLIEPVLEKYGVPGEFKYLVIQESALVPDAVSSSNAVGFWQFKEASATELNMRVDRQIDERMNVISSTEGAAKYLLRSNAEFDNWLYTLQSYMVGQGGTSRSVDKRHYGAREMKVDGDTHWYVKKFLAYMVAFENAAGKQRRNIILYQYTNTGNKSLEYIAEEFGADEEQLISYNKWLKTSSIPDDKAYSVIVPLNVDESEDLLAGMEQDNGNQRNQEGNSNKQQKSGSSPFDKEVWGIVELNDLKGVMAREGDSVEKLAQLGNISEKRFRKFNDLEARDKIKAGQFYYLEKKHRKARVHEHVLQAGESLWEVSQRYGIRLDKLKQKNRLKGNEQVKPGRVLWLRYIRPAKEPAEYRELKETKKNLYASTKTINAGELSTPPPTPKQEPELKKTEETVPPPVVDKAKEVLPQEKDQAMPQEKQLDSQPSQLLFPADTPIQEQKPVRRDPAAEITVVQPDTTFSQVEGSKVQEKSKEKEPAERETDVFAPQKPVQKKEGAPEAEPDDSDDDSFSVNEPVNFIEEEKSTPSQYPAEKELTHQVEAGETLYSLSRRYGVSVQELIKWNNLPSQPVISIGQHLKVSAPKERLAETEQKAQKDQAEAETAPATEAEPAYRLHTVSAGESMYRVARMYNVTIKDIMKWNNKENFDIREGEQLIVGKSLQ